MKFRCPFCNQKMSADTNWRGSEVECPGCRHGITVPVVNLASGDKISGYQVNRLLGAGNMGEVYLATQLSLDRPVALKILAPELVNSEEGLKQFQNEVRILAKVDHPNVVTAYEAGEDQGLYFLAMQYVDGAELDTLVRENGPLKEKDVLDYSAAAADALNTFWTEHDILHRDVKPANMMLDHDNVLKLMDMGISVNVRDEAQKHSFGMVVGTPYYMSPEQARNRRDIDHRADIYSLGATMFYLLTGRVPFPGNDAHEVFARQASDPVPSAKDFNPHISDDCSSLVQHMMAKDREERPPTWTAAIKEISKVRKIAHKRKTPAATKEPVHHFRTTGKAHAVPVARAKRRMRSQQRVAAAVIFLLLTSTVAAVIIGMSLSGSSQDNSTSDDSGASGVVRDEPGDGATDGEKESDKESRDESVSKAETEKKFRKLMAEPYKKIKRFRKEHPEKYDEVIAKLTDLRDEISVSPGQPFLEDVEAMLEEVREERSQAVEEAYADLQRRAQKKLQSDDFETAMRVYENYSGAFADKLRARIEERVEDLRAKHKRRIRRERKRRQKQQREFKELSAAMSRDLISRNLAQAQVRIEDALSKELFREVQERLKAMQEAVRQTRLAQDKIIASLQKQAKAGEQVTLKLTGKEGKVTGELIEVTPMGKIVVDAAVKVGDGTGTIRKTYRVRELSAREKISRFGQAEAPARAQVIAKGLVALWSDHTPAAAHFFRQAFEGPSFYLASSLLKRVEAKEPTLREKSARVTLEKMLSKLGLDVKKGKADLVRAVWRKSPPPETRTKLVAYARLLRGRYAQTRAGGAFRAVTEAVFDRMRADYRDRDVALLQLRRELKEANGLKKLDIGFERLGDGSIAIDLSGMKGVNDLSPLAGAPVARLNLNHTSVEDLGPLDKMPLRELDLAYTPVEDLKPLLGKPLETLILHGTSIRDLTALLPFKTLKTLTFPKKARGRSVLDRLDLRKVGFSDDTFTLNEYRRKREEKQEEKEKAELRSTVKGLRQKLKKANRVGIDQQEGNFRFRQQINGDSVAVSVAYNKGLQDISPLEGMPITELDITGTAVTDLTPLKGMPLKHLKAGHTGVRNLEPLKGMKLKTLYLDHTPLKDFSLVSSFPLEKLSLSGAAVDDEDIFKGLKLVRLSLHDVGLDDGEFDFLENMPLKHLRITRSSLDSLDYLEDKQLKSLNVNDTRVSSLGPLRGHPLTRLRARGTKVDDTRALQDMPISRMNLAGTSVDDLRGLRGMPLKRLDLSGTEVEDITPLKKCVKLTWLDLGGTPVDDLTPLKGLPLETLHLENMPKLKDEDIEALAGLPVKKLFLHGSDDVDDLSPLSGCRQLECLTIPRSTEEMEGLRNLPNLSYIQYEFNWKDRWSRTAQAFWVQWDEKN